MNTQSTMSAASSNYNAENFLTSLYHEPLDKLPQPIVGLHDQVRRQQERAVALLKRFQAPVRPRPEQLSLSAFFGDQSFGQQPQRPLVVDGQPSVVPQASRASVPLGVQPPIQQVMIPDVIDVTTEEPASKRRRTIISTHAFGSSSSSSSSPMNPSSSSSSGSPSSSAGLLIPSSYARNSKPLRFDSDEDLDSDFTKEENDNFNLITTKIRQYFEGQVTDDQRRRLLRMMVLIDFCFQRFGESKFEFTTDEFRAFAEAQGWWTRESNGPFSDQFPMRCFSRYQRGKQSSIRLIDKTPFGTWRLPRRLWNDLSWFLKVTRTPSGPSYSCAISINPGPEGWGDYARRK